MSRSCSAFVVSTDHDGSQGKRLLGDCIGKGHAIGFIGDSHAHSFPGNGLSFHLSPSPRSRVAVKAFTATAAMRAVNSTPHIPMAIASKRARPVLGAKSP